MARKDFKKELGNLKKYLDEKKVQLLSSDEFLHKFISDEKKKYVTQEN